MLLVSAFCDWRHFCLYAGSFYHPRMAASFRFLDELSPAGGRVRGVGATAKDTNSRSSNSGFVISAQTFFQHSSSITLPVSRTHAEPSLAIHLREAGKEWRRRQQASTR
jgi:hypothetical protein